MKNLILLGAALATFAIAGMANAAPSEQSTVSGNKLQCFSGTADGGYNGTCTLVDDGAILDNNDGDADPSNNYSGVYLDNSNLAGKKLSTVNKLAFDYEAADGTTASGGSPRLSIPIDEDGDGAWDGFAFVDTLGCNDGDPNEGTLDAINDDSCLIWYGVASYENWDDFAESNPGYRIASDTIAFVIADQPGEWTITNVQLGKGPAKTK